jgi:hypothetical protein
LSDWLGPTYFNEEVQVDVGSPVRILRQSDKARVRNHFVNSILPQGIVEDITGEIATVRVEDNHGRKVIVRTPGGQEVSVSGHELRRCATCEGASSADLLDPFGGADLHRAHRKLLKKVITKPEPCPCT